MYQRVPAELLWQLRCVEPLRQRVPRADLTVSRLVALAPLMLWSLVRRYSEGLRAENQKGVRRLILEVDRFQLEHEPQPLASVLLEPVDRHQLRCPGSFPEQFVPDRLPLGLGLLASRLGLVRCAHRFPGTGFGQDPIPEPRQRVGHRPELSGQKGARSYSVLPELVLGPTGHRLQQDLP